jgi:hypothetical protein
MKHIKSLDERVNEVKKGEYPKEVEDIIISDSEYIQIDTK